MVPLLCLSLIVLGFFGVDASNEKCINYAKDIYHHHETQAFIASDEPRGTWVSSRCELTRGGKTVSKIKYLYRRFEFDGGQLSANIYHYSDSWCTKPSFTVKFDGRYVIHQRNSSSRFVVSNPSDFKFTNIRFNAGEQTTIENFFTFIMAKCPSALPNYSSMESSDKKIDLKKLIGKDIPLDNYVLRKKHCRFFLGLHPMSYSKTRMVRDKTRSKFTTLYFGDIPPFKTPNMHQYELKHFQYGLARVDRPDCKICALAENADQIPILPAPTSQDGFTGQWVSDKCTAIDEDRYATVFYEFKKDGTFSYANTLFDDGDCKRKSLTYRVGGTYTSFNVADNVKGLIGLRLILKSMQLTPYSKRMLIFLRGSKQCGSAWKLDEEQDLTSSGGCEDLFSQRLPIENPVLVRANAYGEQRELYIENYIRGIAFSSKCVPCDSVTKGFTPRKTTPQPETNEIEISTVPNPNKVAVDDQIDKILKNYKEQGKGPHSSSKVCRCSLLTVLLSVVLSFLIL
ncbi:protein APCDD1-like [Clytia hemisphaerica]|uniref:APCDD1 domain-containing protein n=1 Tax=Clytia hemisphaerica TaxID=252671 RepID=A0A7M5X9I6_9CNID